MTRRYAEMVTPSQVETDVRTLMLTLLQAGVPPLDEESARAFLRLSLTAIDARRDLVPGRKLAEDVALVTKGRASASTPVPVPAPAPIPAPIPAPKVTVKARDYAPQEGTTPHRFLKVLAAADGPQRRTDVEREIGKAIGPSLHKHLVPHGLVAKLPTGVSGRFIYAITDKGRAAIAPAEDD